MKKDKEKCNKGQESIIGKIIYGFLLFLPLIAIGSTILYTAFNKNAFESYAGNKIVKNYTTNEVNNRNDIIYGNMYHIEIDYIPAAMGSGYELRLDTPRIANAKMDIDDSSSVVGTISTNYDCIIYNENYFSYVFKDITKANNLKYYGFRINNQSLHFSCDAIIQNDVNNTLADYMSSGYISITASDFLGEILFNENTYTLDNAFYYAIEKTENSNLFNWAKNSIIYTTTHATCNTLSITNTFIPMLLAYWLIISIMYFLYDIALMLIWLVHRKIHEMQESI